MHLTRINFSFENANILISPATKILSTNLSPISDTTIKCCGHNYLLSMVLFLSNKRFFIYKKHKPSHLIRLLLIMCSFIKKPMVKQNRKMLQNKSLHSSTAYKKNISKYAFYKIFLAPGFYFQYCGDSLSW